MNKYFIGITAGTGITTTGSVSISAIVTNGLIGTKALAIKCLAGIFQGLGGRCRLTTLTNYFFINNHQGSITHSLDVKGKVLRNYIYRPFGQLNKELSYMDWQRPEQAKALQPSYTGQKYEESVGLYNYKARFYDQETGRFMQPDPVQADREGYDNYDAYQYVHNSPANFNDPTGERSKCTGVSNLIIWGNYTGPGACGDLIPGKDQDMMAVWLFNAIDSQNISSSEKLTFKLLIIYWWITNNNPNLAISEVDKVSQIHDRDGPRFSSSYVT